MKINVKNMELLDEFEKRTMTYENLLSDLKKLNSMIQNFSNLKSKFIYNLSNFKLVLKRIK
jgi:hypothetical protein